MKKMINLKSMLVALSMAMCAMIAVSCDDDDEPGIMDDSWTTYEGTCIYTGSMRGTQVMNDTVRGQITIGYCNGQTVLGTDDLDSLVIKMTQMTINMPSFQIPITVYGDSIKPTSFVLDSVYCQMIREGAGELKPYATTGDVAGFYNAQSADVNYSFKLGSMPFPICVAFKGKAVKK